MDSKTLSEVNAKVYRKYPEVNAVRPSVAKNAAGETVLTYKSRHETPDGHSIQSTVHVVVSQDGRIIKTSISH